MRKTTQSSEHESEQDRLGPREVGRPRNVRSDLDAGKVRIQRRVCCNAGGRSCKTRMKHPRRGEEELSEGSEWCDGVPQ